MTYYSTMGGAAGFGGFGYFGLSGTYPVQRTNSDMLSVQRELQRLGYLQEGGGVYGADGKFGPRTAMALRGASRYVGWTDAPYSPPNAGELRSGEVTIPDDLIERLRAARPDPNAPHAAGGEPPPPPDAPVKPERDSSSSAPLVNHEDGSSPSEGSGTGWVPAAVIGGGVLAVGAVIAYSMYGGQKKKKTKRTKRRKVAANRRRSRRRRTSRRR